MKTKLLTLMLVFSMVITGVISFSSVAKAAGNITDEPYEFYNTGSTGHSNWREKRNDSSVYINPQSGPTIYYTVYGAKGQFGVDSKPRSSTVAIGQGIQASVINSVNERGDNYARLEFGKITYAAAFTRGVWSPDSVGTFTIYR